MVKYMHRELKLVENGVEVAAFFSDHNDHNDHNGSGLEKDLMAFVNKVERKKQMNLKKVFYELLVKEVFHFGGA